MKETDRRIEASRKETERLFRESLLRMDKADKKLRNLNDQFVSQTGHILEGMEIDLLYVDTTEAIAVEVKTQCTKSKIDHFLKQMRHFKRLYPRFADLEVYVAIAALNYAMDSESYARASLWCRDVVYRVPTVVVYRVPTVVVHRVPTVVYRVPTVVVCRVPTVVYRVPTVVVYRVPTVVVHRVYTVVHRDLIINSLGLKK